MIAFIFSLIAIFRDGRIIYLDFASGVIDEDIES